MLLAHLTDEETEDKESGLNSPQGLTDTKLRRLSLDANILTLAQLCLPTHPRTSCCRSVAQPCLTLCDPMDCSVPGFPIHDIIVQNNLPICASPGSESLPGSGLSVRGMENFKEKCKF